MQARDSKPAAAARRNESGYVPPLVCTSRSVEQTQRLGARLGEMLQPGDLICLIGDLGAGKTTLVQGIAAGWGSLDQASSPTFVLVNVYRRRASGGEMAGRNAAGRNAAGRNAVGQGAEEMLYHLDAYRLSGAAEALDLDLDSLLENGPLLIEWADRIQSVLPKERLWITLRWAKELDVYIQDDFGPGEMPGAPGREEMDVPIRDVPIRDVAIRYDQRELAFTLPQTRHESESDPTRQRYEKMLAELRSFWSKMNETA